MNIELPTITQAKLILTEECQLNCKYCYGEHSKKSMSLTTAKAIIDKIINIAESVSEMPSISFFGGEPLLVYDELLKPCIEYIRVEKNSRCLVSFTTNGILLDEEKLKYLKSRNVTFMLSLDGCKDSHDTNRVYANGEGSFSDVEKNIPKILQYYPNTRARMTLTPENAEYLYESIKYVADKGFIDMHIIPDLFILSDRKWDHEDFSVLSEQMKLVEDYIIETFEDSEIPLVFKTLEDMIPRIVLSQYCEQTNKHRTALCCSSEKRCGIGVLKNVIIDTEGNTFSCQHGSSESVLSNPLYLGNFLEGIIEERRHTLLDMNRDPLHSNSLDCSDCPLNRVCTGGCVPNNYLVNGDFNIVPESYCLWTKQLYESALRIITYFDEKKDSLLFKDYFYGVVKRGVTCVC